MLLSQKELYTVPPPPSNILNTKKCKKKVLEFSLIENSPPAKYEPDKIKNW